VTIVQGNSYIDNPIRRLLAPRAGQKIVITHKDGLPVSVVLYGAARSYGIHKPEFKAVEIVYSPSTKNIDVTMFEDRREVSVPLSLKFLYRPEQPFAPIHEIAEGRNQRIKDFYWRLWYGDKAKLPKIDLTEKFVGPEVTIDADDIETFCGVVGNQGESFKSTREDDVKAPMDFAIVTGWQAIMKSIFPEAIDGDLLKLVHLTNGFRTIPGTRPLQAGDVCKAEAGIVSVTNTDAGKVVKVKGQVYRAGQPVIEVTSSFLYRGRFTDFNNTFEVIKHPDYEVELADDAAVGILQSKEWFEWNDDTSPPEPGTKLIFQTQSRVTYKDKTSYHEVTVSGGIFIRNQLKQLISVGSVEFQQEDCKGNPVLSYLERHGAPQGLMTPLANDGYSLTSSGTTIFNSPLTNEPYSKISGDFNPIHVNPYFSNYASLPGTITHGMWSSAATRRYVESVVAKGHPERVVS
jgi:fatty acid synthase subunit alpha, fungi type